jgi:hypothetical protein
MPDRLLERLRAFVPGSTPVVGSELEYFRAYASEASIIPVRNAVCDLPSNVLRMSHKLKWLDDAMEVFLENRRRYRAAEPLVNVVDVTRGY